MQKTAILFFILSLALWGNAQTVADTKSAPMPTTPANWARLTDSTYTLRFPATWNVDKSGLLGSRFFLFAPLDSNDTFRENFNLIINDMSIYPELSLEYMADGARQQVESMIQDCKVQEFRIVNQEDNSKYYILEYSGKQGKFDLHWKQVYFMVNNQFYVLTFTAEAPQYERYLPLADRIFASFTFK